MGMEPSRTFLPRPRMRLPRALQSHPVEVREWLEVGAEDAGQLGVPRSSIGSFGSSGRHRGYPELVDLQEGQAAPEPGSRCPVAMPSSSIFTHKQRDETAKPFQSRNPAPFPDLPAGQ
jgi:hypothetical protein